jgi:hypothetical protein
MPEQDPKLPPGVPRPPSLAAVDRLSGQQGIITDEWTGDPPAEPERPIEPPVPLPGD